MKDYFIFDEFLEYELLAGAHYKEYENLSSEERKDVYVERINMWSDFRQHCRETKRPLIILINGCSNSGKSSWSIEITRRLGIRNLIHTDTVRSVLRQVYLDKKESPIHHSTYQSWLACDDTYSPEALIKGFRKQSELVISHLYTTIDEAIDYGKFTVIEGIHLIPSLIDFKRFESSYLLQLFFSVNSENAQKERLERRFKSDYFNRYPGKYESYADAFQTLREYLTNEAKLSSMNTIENESATKTLDSITFIINNFIKGIISDQA